MAQFAQKLAEGLELGGVQLGGHGLAQGKVQLWGMFVAGCVVPL